MKNENRTVFKAFTLIAQFSINMIVPIALCCVGGYFLDKKFNTSFWFILLFFVGALAGGRNVYIFAKDIMNAESSDRRHGKNKEQ